MLAFDDQVERLGVLAVTGCFVDRAQLAAILAAVTLPDDTVVDVRASDKGIVGLIGDGWWAGLVPVRHDEPVADRLDLEAVPC